jgi:hypothetical protein
MMGILNPKIKKIPIKAYVANMNLPSPDYYPQLALLHCTFAGSLASIA